MDNINLIFSLSLFVFMGIIISMIFSNAIFAILCKYLVIKRVIPADDLYRYLNASPNLRWLTVPTIEYLKNKNLTLFSIYVLTSCFWFIGEIIVFIGGIVYRDSGIVIGAMILLSLLFSYYGVKLVIQAVSNNK